MARKVIKVTEGPAGLKFSVAPDPLSFDARRKKDKMRLAHLYIQKFYIRKSLER